MIMKLFLSLFSIGLLVACTQTTITDGGSFIDPGWNGVSTNSMVVEVQDAPLSEQRAIESSTVAILREAGLRAEASYAFSRRREPFHPRKNRNACVVVAMKLYWLSGPMTAILSAIIPRRRRGRLAVQVTAAADGAVSVSALILTADIPQKRQSSVIIVIYTLLRIITKSGRGIMPPAAVTACHSTRSESGLGKNWLLNCKKMG